MPKPVICRASTCARVCAPSPVVHVVITRKLIRRTRGGDTVALRRAAASGRVSSDEDCARAPIVFAPTTARVVRGLGGGRARAWHLTRVTALGGSPPLWTPPNRTHYAPRTQQCVCRASFRSVVVGVLVVVTVSVVICPVVKSSARAFSVCSFKCPLVFGLWTFLALGKSVNLLIRTPVVSDIITWSNRRCFSASFRGPKRWIFPYTFSSRKSTGADYVIIYRSRSVSFVCDGYRRYCFTRTGGCLNVPRSYFGRRFCFRHLVVAYYPIYYY